MKLLLMLSLLALSSCASKVLRGLKNLFKRRVKLKNIPDYAEIIKTLEVDSDRLIEKIKKKKAEKR